MNNENTKKFKNIEFLRVIGCLSIIFKHLFGEKILFKIFPDISLYQTFNLMTSDGGKAVELFFIFSGFFFIYKLNLHQSIWEFLKKKIIHFWPVLIFLIVTSYFVSLTGIIKWNFYDNLMLLLGLSGTSLVLRSGIIMVAPFWYVSAMVWVLLLFFYLFKNYEKKNVLLFIAVLVFFVYSYLIHAQDGFIGHRIKTYYNIYNVGMMRAMGAIGVGLLIGEWYKNNAEKIQSFTLNIYQQLAITVIELYCLYFIISYLMLQKILYDNYFIFIVIFALSLILFLIKKGFISKLADRQIFVHLSKYTYSIYMVHIFIFAILKSTLWKHHKELVYAYPVLNIIFALVVVIAFGIFTYHCVEKPFTNYFKKKAKNN